MKQFLLSIFTFPFLFGCNSADNLDLDNYDVYEFSISDNNIDGVNNFVSVSFNNDIGWYSMRYNGNDDNIYDYLINYTEKNKTNNVLLYFEKGLINIVQD